MDPQPGRRQNARRAAAGETHASARAPQASRPSGSPTASEEWPPDLLLADAASRERTLARVQAASGNLAAAVLVQRTPDSDAASGGSARAVAPVVLELAVRDRVKDWRLAAGDGLQDFVEHELFAAITEKDADWRGFGMSFAGNVLWAMACFNPVGAAAMKAFVLSVEGIAIAAMGSLPSSSTAKGEDPAEITKRALRAIVTGVQMGLYDSIRDWVEEESRSPHPTVDQVVEGTLMRLFDIKYLRTRGDSRRLMEINQPAVTAEFKRQATAFLARYKAQVQPIGSEPGGHRKYVPVRVRGGTSDGRYVLALRRLADDVNRYEFVRWIDEDMAAGASARGMDVEEALTIVDASAIENLPQLVRPLESGVLHERF